MGLTDLWNVLPENEALLWKNIFSVVNGLKAKGRPNTGIVSSDPS
jgi:hypothetical protein